MEVSIFSDLYNIKVSILYNIPPHSSQSIHFSGLGQFAGNTFIDPIEMGHVIESQLIRDHRCRPQGAAEQFLCFFDAQDIPVLRNGNAAGESVKAGPKVALADGAHFGKLRDRHLFVRILSDKIDSRLQKLQFGRQGILMGHS